MEVKIQKLRPGAVTPRRGSADAAGYDLYACPADGQCVTIAPHVTAMIGTGLALAIPAGYFGGVFARSGLASKQGLRPANCVGVIDADYRGECTVALHNDTDEVRTVAPGDRIAQLVILPFLAAEFAEADALDETDRGAGGFGSTGRYSNKKRSPLRASRRGLRFALFSGKLALFSGSLRIRARIRRASRTCSAGCCPRTRAASAA